MESVPEKIQALVQGRIFFEVAGRAAVLFSVKCDN